MNLFDLMAKISLDTSEYDAGLERSEKAGKTFGDSLKTGLATAGKVGAIAVGAVAAGTALLGKTIVGQTGKLASYGDHIDKTSQKMGISAQAYQEWDAILQHSGSSIDGMQRGMMTLTNKVVSGSEAFDKLGISQESVASMNKEDLFSAVITGLQGMEDGSERAALAQELLGTAAKELGPLLNTSAEETEAMRQRVHELGGVMSDEAVKAAAAYQDTLQDMKTAIAGLKRGLVTDFLPGITSIMDGITSIFSDDPESGKSKIKEGLSGVLKNISDTIPQIIEKGGEVVSGLGQAIMESLPMLVEQGTQIILTIANGIVQSLPSIVQAGFDIIDGLTSGIGEAAPTLIPAMAEALVNLLQSIVDNIGSFIDSGVSMIQGIVDGIASALPILIESAPAIITGLLNAIVESLPTLVESGISMIDTIANSVVSSIPLLLAQAPTIISELSTALVENLPTLIESGTGMIETVTSAVVSSIPTLIEQAPTIISSLLDALIESAPTLVESGITMVSTIADALIGAIPSLIEAAPQLVTSLLNAVIERAPDMLDAGVSLMTSLIDGIGSMLESIWGKVQEAVDGIKGIFDFDWSLPHIKLPHFSLGAGITVLGVTLPSINVSWYKKAYEQPYLFNNPTVVGNMGFGDGVGGEMVYGHENLMRDIKQAVAEASDETRVIKLYLDGDKLVGGTSERMDTSLGQMQAYQLRWEGAV